MTTTLTLLIASDWPHGRRACPWLLHAADGRLLERGCSEPAHWPRPAEGDARDCQLLLAGRQLSCQRVQLPKTSLGRSPDVVAAALEEVLLDDAGQLAFAVAPTADADGASSIGIISRQRLGSIVGQLGELGLRPRSAWPLGMALTAPAAWAWAWADELSVALPGRGFVSLPLDEQLGAWLERLDLDAKLPLTLPEQSLAPAAAAALAAQEAAERLCRRSPPDDPLPPSGPGFLYGELAPPRRDLALRRALTTVARLGAGFAAAALLLSATQWAWHAWQAHGHRQAIAAHFRAAMPQAVMVDPPLQMQRRVDAARRASGQLAADDFLPLLETLAELPAASLEISELDYADGRLRVSAQFASDALERLRDAAGRRQLVVDLKSEPGAGERGPTLVELSRSSER